MKETLQSVPTGRKGKRPYKGPKLVKYGSVANRTAKSGPNPDTAGHKKGVG